MTQTPCDPAQRGREDRGKAKAGVMLLGGVSTGMSKDEVRQIAPQLMEKRPRLQELFPGSALHGAAFFYKERGPLEGVIFRGPYQQAPRAALTARFGAPVNVDYIVNDIDVLGKPMATFRNVRPTTVDKWCDGERVYLLRVEPDQFSLKVTAPTVGR